MSEIDKVALERGTEAAWRTFHEALRKANPGLPPIRPWAQEHERVRQMYRDMVKAGLDAALTVVGLGVIAREELAKHDIAQPGALQDIAIERRRQVEDEGFSTDRDDCYGCGELALAGAAYAAYGSAQADGSITIGTRALDLWPWRSAWWKPKDRRSNLVRAGALIVAEIERIDRAAAKAVAAS